MHCRCNPAARPLIERRCSGFASALHRGWCAGSRKGVGINRQATLEEIHFAPVHSQPACGRVRPASIKMYQSRLGGDELWFVHNSTHWQQALGEGGQLGTGVGRFPDHPAVLSAKVFPLKKRKGAWR